MLKDDVVARLNSLGYAATGSDDWMINFVMTKVESQIKGQCNTLVIPEGLNEKAIDMVVGEFLFGKKSSGQLTSFNFDGAVKKIQEGDTNIEFASKTPEERFDVMIGFMMRDPDYASYRRIRW